MRRIVSDSGVTELAELILDRGRVKPTCVVSSDPEGRWRITGDEIAEEVGEIAEIFEIPNGHFTHLLEAKLPAGTVVFGGAVRVYPPNFALQAAPEAAPLFQFTSEAGARHKKQRVIDTIWMMAKDAGLLEKPVDQQVKAEGVISRIFGSERAIVTLRDGTMATIRQEVSFPDVPLDWIFSVGDAVKGTHDVTLGILQPQSAELSRAELLAHFGNREVTLGLVKATSRTEAQIALLPSVVFTVPKDHISGNPMDVIDRYLEEGDVVRVRIYRDEQGRPALRLDDIEDDEDPLSALPLVDGGRPWLEPGRYIVGHQAEPVEAVVLPSVVTQLIDDLLEGGAEAPVAAVATGPIPRPPGLQAAVLPPLSAKAALTRQQKAQAAAQALMNNHTMSRIDQLNNAINVMDQELAEANRKISEANDRYEAEVARSRRYREELNEYKNAERVAGKTRSTTRSRRDRFASDEDWFDEEIRRAWIGRYTPHERVTSFPLLRDSYSYAPEFFASISPQRVDEGELRKLVRVVLDVVTGRESKEHKHGSHPWLTKLGGKPITTAEGAVCMRVAIEQRQPQAKRLKYFQNKNSGVRLASVHPHDEELD